MEEYYKLLGIKSNISNKDLKKKYIQLMRESHPDKGYDDEWCKKINEAYQKIVDYRNNVNGFDKNLCLIPKKFREMGFDNIPTVGQYVRKLIEMENNKKLKGDENVLENDILKLQDKKNDTLFNQFIGLFF